jgi:hypothetical protein
MTDLADRFAEIRSDLEDVLEDLPEKPLGPKPVAGLGVDPDPDREDWVRLLHQCGESSLTNLDVLERASRQINQTEG